MNAFIIIAAIVCITVITVFAIVMCKKIDKIARVYNDTALVLIDSILTEVRKTRKDVNGASGTIDTRIKETSENAAAQMCEVITLAKEAKELAEKGIKVTIDLQSVRPVEAPKPKAEKKARKAAPKAEKAEKPKVAKKSPKAKKEAKKEEGKPAQDIETYKKVMELRAAGKSLRQVAAAVGFKSARSVGRIIEKGNKNNW